MFQRSSHNWKTKSGTWDSLNISLIDFVEDFPVLSSICYSATYMVNINDYKHIGSGSLVSTFVDDYILERYWNHPLNYIHKLKQAANVMSPDFSLLVGMPKPLQMYNVYRNRLVGYIWQSRGINVIPAVSWSDNSSFDYCFEGIREGSIVAVSNIGCRNDEHKRYFDAGFNEMNERLNPKMILFVCNKKYRSDYSGKNVVILDSFFENRRKILKAA